ncbi:MAG: nuclear transport factor 2 family protein [Proteobacteria bacterium]|nr:nuclear transport factor 2 family protein [Pseudomonadota bacterium]MBI3495901.1 nuclear transport factor 2 family protein [Pseudomonadota bacterium]
MSTRTSRTTRERVPGEAKEVESVLASNREFYRAFRERDLPAMERLWADNIPVACVHPGWDALTSRNDIIDSWRGILANRQSPRIHCQDEAVLFVGETAMVLCHEIVGDQALVATNVLIKQDTTWRFVHHQATPLAGAMGDEDDEHPTTVH